MLEKIKEQLEELPVWQRALLVVVVAAGIIFALHKFVVVEEKKKIEAINQEISNLRAEIKKYQQTINPVFLENLRKELKRLREEEVQKRKEFEEVVGKVPYKEEVNVIIKEIGNIALNSGLAILKMEIQDPKKLHFTVNNGIVQIVNPAANQNAQGNNQGAQAQAQAQQAPQGVPLYIFKLAMKIEGSSEAILNFFSSLAERGIVSYPEKVELKPIPETSSLSGSAIINIVAQVRQ